MEKNPERLSKGCQLCQQGKWLCIFLTFKCSASCHFCASPFKYDNVHSAFGNEKEMILSYLINSDFEGISFSGGDPFLVYERLLEWLVFFKKHLPHYYYWVYTNGLHSNSQRLKKLADEGMNEIRFNIAATGYLSSAIHNQIALARKYFPYVSVEIPSIAMDYDLLAKACERLDKTGIDYLNLHDYIISEGDMAGVSEHTEVFVLNKSIPLKYAPSSHQNTNMIVNLSSLNKYAFHINHCSMERKENQMLQRRLKVGAILSDPDHDFIGKDGLLYNFYNVPREIYLNNQCNNILSRNPIQCFSSYLVQKNKINDTIRSENIIIMVRYVPKIEINQERIFLNMKIISNHELTAYIIQH